MSNRLQDTLTSTEVEKFLDANFYVKPVERVYDKERQIMGIDVVFGDHFIDEKCATDYINKPLKTFSFELSSVDRNGNRYTGWLLNDKLKTTHYLLCYINKCKVDKNPKMEDIFEMETIYVAKEVIKQYLEDKGIDLKNLSSVKENSIGGLRIVRSGHKAEKPMNILIPREVLRNLGISEVIGW